ncbi:MAG: TatD family hydrolase [Candidatus Sumerlaea chitinivorans]|uniref:Deoxyribonuclease YcfH n=1 Tax=Sumerlaea chitinivorans TaxID=2250252 RepID=A0A2Z4Y2P1_SUMC1|nr:Putative deoxyribonuclease YcfH [Candidatus Sumerlaea chitinivorans]MCX7963496.1 TatD family hydrolase [Candidatus Sumerlaea chitinivorans]
MSLHPLLWDTHAHLQDSEFADDFDEVLGRALVSGVQRIVLIGETIENSKLALGRAQAHEALLATVGIHPHHAQEFCEQSLNALRDLVRASKKVVGIGEIGLDYHYDFAPRDQQIRAFIAQFQLATELGLPVVIHCREAYSEMLEILPQDEAPSSTPPRGVMHCFFGTQAQAEEFIRRGFLLGVGGAVTFKKTVKLQEIVRTVPLESLVLETDAPYMAPVPYRGKRNEPAYLRLVAERIAQLRAIPVEEVARTTTENALRLFRRVDASRL